MQPLVGSFEYLKYNNQKEKSIRSVVNYYSLKPVVLNPSLQRLHQSPPFILSMKQSKRMVIANAKRRRCSHRSRNPSAPISNSNLSPHMRKAEQILGYTFHNRRLLEEALTHSSFSNGSISYERLEFVGDAALNLAMTNYLYSSHPDLGPGKLTKLRSVNLCNENLARVAVRHGLYPLVQHDCPKLDKQVENFTKAVNQESVKDQIQIHNGSTEKAPKILADIVEAIAAAVYEDCIFDLDVMWKVFRGLLEPLITADTSEKKPVTKLGKSCQKRRKNVNLCTGKKRQKIVVHSKKIVHKSSKRKTIGLKEVRNALEKLKGENSNSDLLVKLRPKQVKAEKKAKQNLNKCCMERHWPLPVYKLEKKPGPTQSSKFICSVRVKARKNNFVAIGDYRSRVRDAERSAALNILPLLVTTSKKKKLSLSVK